MLETLYKEALDRKENPKEGSYTNYLFDKGLDKILKKVGEEATEVVIGAKNADKIEIASETADLLYHLAVMLVETGVTPADVEAVLKSRQGKQSNVHDRKEITDYQGVAKMITAEDIVEKQFSATFRGYNQEEVDEFLDDIIETLKTLEKEKQSLKRQVKRLKEDQWDL